MVVLTVRFIVSNLCRSAWGQPSARRRRCRACSASAARRLPCAAPSFSHPEAPPGGRLKTSDSGPCALSQTTYFGALGLECLPEYNPADFFLDVVSMDYRTPEAEAECRERVRLLAEVYAQSQGGQHVRGLASVTPGNVMRKLCPKGVLGLDRRALDELPDVRRSPLVVLLGADLGSDKPARSTCLIDAGCISSAVSHGIYRPPARG